MIRIIAIGKKHESWVVEGVERYQKRLRKPFDVDWVLLPHSSREGLTARKEESDSIRGRLGKDDCVLLLDERGKLFGSCVFSRLLMKELGSSSAVSIVIGGAYGVDEGLRERANTVISLSQMVFPHQLVRLILIEQMYRAQEIAVGSPYHHE